MCVLAQIVYAAALCHDFDRVEGIELLPSLYEASLVSACPIQCTHVYACTSTCVLAVVPLPTRACAAPPAGGAASVVGARTPVPKRFEARDRCVGAWVLVLLLLLVVVVVVGLWWRWRRWWWW